MTEPALRRQFVKGYLWSLATDGEFKGLSPAGVIAKATATFATDVVGAAGEMAVEAGGQAADWIGGKIGEQLRKFVGAVKDKGWRHAWKKVQEQYERGVEANANAGRKR
jgi:hypothetical protein